MAVSVRDVAAAAGVSVGTVSNVLNRPAKVAPATVERVTAAIDQLGFIRNDAARQLRAGRSRSVGLVVLDLRNPFFTDVARGAEDAAIPLGLSVLVANSDEKTSREDGHLALFEEQRVFGVLVTPASDDVSRLTALVERGTPVVLVDRTSRDKRFASVSVDDVAGGALAAKHLLAQGRHRLAFVGGPLAIAQVSDRLAGAQHVVYDHEEAQLQIIGTNALTVEEGRRAAARILAMSPATRPDAVFAANDLVAIGLIQGLFMTGDVRIPEDIAIVGYDDIDFASSAVVPLTSVRQPAAKIGATAIELLTRLVEGEEVEERNVMYQPELVVRASSTSN